MWAPVGDAEGGGDIGDEDEDAGARAADDPFVRLLRERDREWRGTAIRESSFAYNPHNRPITINQLQSEWRGTAIRESSFAYNPHTRPITINQLQSRPRR